MPDFGDFCTKTVPVTFLIKELLRNGLNDSLLLEEGDSTLCVKGTLAHSGCIHSRRLKNQLYGEIRMMENEELIRNYTTYHRGTYLNKIRVL